MNHFVTKQNKKVSIMNHFVTEQNDFVTEQNIIVTKQNDFVSILPNQVFVIFFPSLSFYLNTSSTLF